MAVRTDGHWEQWIKFFLRGVSEVSLDATETARRILSLREESRTRLTHVGSTSNLAHRLLDLLFKNPMITVRFVTSQLGCSFAKASQLVGSFQQSELGLLEETTGFARNRKFRFKPYLDLFPEAKFPPGDSTSLSGDLYARSTITPTGSRQSFVAILKVPKAKIQKLRQDPMKQVFSDAQLISNYAAPWVAAKVYPVPGGTSSIGSKLYPEGLVPSEIQDRTDSQQVGDVTYWLLGTEPA